MFRLARLGLAPVFGDGTQELSAVHGADLADALIAAGTGRATVGRTYYACHAEVFTSAELARGASAGRWAAADRVIRVPCRVGRGVLARDRDGRAARGPDDHPHRRQGERVLPAGLDRRSRAAHAGQRLARRARPPDRAGARPTSGTGAPGGCSRPAGAVRSRLGGSCRWTSCCSATSRSYGGAVARRAAGLLVAPAATRSRWCSSSAHPPRLGPFGRALGEIYPSSCSSALRRARRSERRGGVRGARCAGAALGDGGLRGAGEPRVVAGGAEPRSGRRCCTRRTSPTT